MITKVYPAHSRANVKHTLIGGRLDIKLKTRVFDVCNEKYSNLTELAQAMGIATSQVYRVKKGERRINGKFIVGTVKAFPGYKLDDLFYIGKE